MILSALPPVAAKQGRYTLARTSHVERRLCVTDPRYSRATAFNIHETASLLPGSAILFLETSHLPPAVKEDFARAGKEFTADLQTLCSFVAFCDQLELDGRWTNGFLPEIETEQALPELLSGLEQPSAAKTIFLNRHFEDGRPLPDILISEPLSWFLGQRKADSLLAVNGLAPDALTAGGKDYFAYTYQLAMKKALFAGLQDLALATTGFSYVTTGLGVNNLRQLETLAAKVRALEPDLSSFDRLVLATLDHSRHIPQ